MTTRALFLAALVIATQLPAQRSDTTVRIAGPAKHPGGGVLVKELAIGDASGVDEYTFRSISRVLLARDGTIWIHEPGGGRGSAGTIRRYDTKGKFLNNVGRDGDGPGEYRNPSGMAQLKDGRVILKDGNSRINVYSEAGKADTTWTLRSSYPVSVPADPLTIDAQGIVWLAYGQRDSAMRSPFDWPARLLRLRANGQIIDTLSAPVLLPPGTNIWSVRQRPGLTFSMFAPYTKQARWALHPDGYFATAMTDRYAIDLRVPAKSSSAEWQPGQPVVSLRRTDSPVQVSDAERRDYVAYMKGHLDGYPTAIAPPIPDIPSTKPPIREIRFSTDGRLWVLVSVPSERYEPPPATVRQGRPPTPQRHWREPEVYDVFERDGSYVGRVKMPEGGRTVSLRGDEVWRIMRDEDDVQSLVKYRVQWR